MTEKRRRLRVKRARKKLKLDRLYKPMYKIIFKFLTEEITREQAIAELKPFESKDLQYFKHYHSHFYVSLLDAEKSKIDLLIYDIIAEKELL